MSDEVPDLPDPDDLDGLHEFFQNILGPGFKVSFPETIVDDDSQTVMGMVVEASDGRMIPGSEIAELFAAKGVEIGYGGGMKVPDHVPDDLTGSLDPTTLIADYGPHAPEFVDQIGRLINVEWFEQYQILANVVGHLKAMGLDEEMTVHLFGVFGYLPISVLRNRMYLGSLLEGYRRDNDLDAEALQVLVKTASQRVRDLVYGNAENEEDAVAITTMLRGAYLGEEEFKDSWPPASESSIRTLWKGVEIADEDDT